MRLKSVLFGSLSVAAACAGPAASDEDSVGVTMSALSLEIVESNRESDAALNLVARVEVEPGYLLEFYEPSPGQILLSGAGRPTESRKQEALLGKNDGDDLATVWSLASNNAAMPPALKAALKRRTDLAKNGGRAESASERSRREAGLPDAEAAAEPQAADAHPSHEHPGIGVNAAATHTGWCSNNWFTQPTAAGYCNDSRFEYSSRPAAQTTPGTWGEFCNIRRESYTDWFDTYYTYRTGSYWSANYDVRHFWANVCAVAGSITYVMSGEWTNSWNVPDDTVRWTSWHEPGDNCDSITDPFNDCPTIRMDIMNATGDVWNWNFITNDS